MDFFGELEWRGLVHEASEGARQALAREKVTAYIGFDPTAESLHVGSLLPILALVRLQGFGHSSIALVGGGTGLIGDPSGKTGERQLLNDEHVKTNVAAIRKQLAKILSSASRRMCLHQPQFQGSGKRPRLEDNARWLKKLTAITFMRDVGKHFTVNWMLSKESVKRRLNTNEGISYTEFSYLLLQAYDFLELNRLYHCTLQLGGSDQWGNITAGMELVRRVRNAKVHGLVLPLVTTSSGTKFGKTEAGTIWLDAKRTKPYEFYQFWLNADDGDAVRYLKFFTFLDRHAIANLEEEGRREPERRLVQKALAREVTRIVHGNEGVRTAEANTSIHFSRSADPNELRLVPDEDKIRLPRALFERGILVAQVLRLAKMAPSNSEGARLIRAGAVLLEQRENSR